MAVTNKTNAGAARKPNEAGSCEHCGALVYADAALCAQCGKFPILLRHCPKCACISAKDADRCWQCGRIFEPDGDFL
jgi:hypothetical protein